MKERSLSRTVEAGMMKELLPKLKL